MSDLSPSELREWRVRAITGHPLSPEDTLRLIDWHERRLPDDQRKRLKDLLDELSGAVSSVDCLVDDLGLELDRKQQG